MIKKKLLHKLNNQGMSLIELIAVILILGILCAGAFSGISSIISADVNGCAKRLSALLDRTRLETMSRAGSIRLEIIADAKGAYRGVIINNVNGAETIIAEDKLGSASLTITGYSEAGAAAVVSSTSALILTFNKGTGSRSSVYERIEVKASKSIYIYIVKETGRNYAE